MYLAKGAVESMCGHRSCSGYVCGRANACFRRRKSGGDGAMLIRERHVAPPSESYLVAAAETLSRNAISLAVTQLSRIGPTRALTGRGKMEQRGPLFRTEALLLLCKRMGGDRLAVVLMLLWGATGTG